MLQVIAIVLFVADNNGVYAVADILGHLTVGEPRYVDGTTLCF